jgi:hypothetical protein
MTGGNSDGSTASPLRSEATLNYNRQQLGQLIKPQYSSYDDRVIPPQSNALSVIDREVKKY